MCVWFVYYLDAMFRKFVFILCLILPVSLFGQQEIIINDSVKVVPLTERVWVHVCGQYYPAFGHFTSNGAIYVNGNEAVIMDTPPSKEQAEALLDWFASRFPDVLIKAVIINHFHDDCIGGIEAFKSRGIPSWAGIKTVEALMERTDSPGIPEHYFKKKVTINVGDSKVINFYPGPAHTRDNIVTWIPGERVLFGGCMVKAAGATRGNVADADLKAWPATITKVMRKFPDAASVVPGHGDTGGQELLTYTRDLFRR